MKDDPRAFAAELATDLRNWLEWAALTGAVEVPTSPSIVATASITQTPPTPTRSAAPPRERAQPAPVEAPRASALPAQRVTPRVAASAQPIAPPPTSSVAQGEAGLKQVRDEYGDCQRCRLGRERKNLVFGIGNPKADLVLVGEAPGQQEDLSGEPFVGRAGQLLTRMLGTIGLAREQVYICNVIKCRPPQNRDPLPDEAASCSPFLHRQLRAIEPKVIMTLGRFAATTVVGVEGNMGELRKRTGSWNGVPIISTYHPSYLLRTPHMKRAAWEDLLKVRGLLRAAP